MLLNGRVLTSDKRLHGELDCADTVITNVNMSHRHYVTPCQLPLGYGLFYSKNKIKAGQICITASDDVIATLELCIDTCLRGFQRGHFLKIQIDFN